MYPEVLEPGSWFLAVFQSRTSKTADVSLPGPAILDKNTLVIDAEIWRRKQKMYLLNVTEVQNLSITPLIISLPRTST